jgi:hypothetical protein
MISENAKISTIRRIDNSRTWLPFATSFLLIFLIVLIVWFFRGGSFKLYASIFFTLYSVTHQVWLSVLLIGILQNIIFLPLRIIGNYVDKPLKDFEDELDNLKQDEQYFIFTKRVREGSLPIVFFIFNFFVNAIAFFSAGRIFLIDFYNNQLNTKYLYSFVPYPDYPLQGTIFHFPFFKITQTYAIPWHFILWSVFGVILFMTALRLVWRILKIFLWRNKSILSARINYNRLLIKMSSISGVVLIGIIYLLRHFPVSFQGLVFNIDLTRQNTPMNFVTAFATFLTTLHANYKNNMAAAKTARKANVPKEIIKKVFKEKMKQGFQNALILGAGAFFVTNNIPSAFELSVAMFEVMYFIYPYTFGLFIKKSVPQRSVAPVTVTEN